MFNPTYRQYQEQRETILQCIELADEVWCSTQGVRDSLGKGIIIPNALNDYLLPECVPFNVDSNRIVWRGGASHEADVYEHADKIVELVNSHTELDFYFIGYRFTYLEQRCGDNYFAVDQMPLMQYFDYLRSLQPRAMIFPLCDTPLNRAKSAISFYEATWAGAAYFGNTLMPELNIDGSLDIYFIDRFINDIENSKYAHKYSEQNIEQNFLLSDINKLRERSLLEI
jgi:hypothetical protein